MLQRREKKKKHKMPVEGRSSSEVMEEALGLLCSTCQLKRREGPGGEGRFCVAVKTHTWEALVVVLKPGVVDLLCGR